MMVDHEYRDGTAPVQQQQQQRVTDALRLIVIDSFPVYTMTG